MRNYRLYCLDSLGHVAKGEWIQAASDDEAIAAARLKMHPTACELWDRDRLVAEIPAHFDGGV